MLMLFLYRLQLHYAALSDDPETVHVLLENGANPVAESDSGHLPKQYAKDSRIKKLLDAYAVKVILLFDK